MSFKRTTYADESLSQVWLRRDYRATGLMWGSGVVLHDSWWCEWMALLDRVWGLEGCLRLRWDLITLVFDDVIYQWHHIK